MLPMISQLGVGTLIVTNAFKVEADYWGSHLLRSTEAVEELCIEGLAQSGDVHLPRVVFAKRLKAFLEDDLDVLLPPELSQRVVAHPYPLKGRTTLNSGRVSELPPPSAVHGPGELPRILVAVGPEGGWDGNGHELGMLSAKGFGSVSLGPRILRSDVAVNSLLALAQEQIRSWDTADDP
jgi:RsmE family RNA methyltransferase